MKTIKYIALTAFAFASTNIVATDSQAQDYLKDVYMTIGAGKSQVKKVDHLTHSIATTAIPYKKEKLKNSNVFKVAVGKGYGSFRTEVELIYGDKHKFANSVNGVNTNFKVDHRTVFINNFYSYKKFGKVFMPYVGFGVGASRNTVNQENYTSTLLGSTMSHSYAKKSKTSFAYNLSVGALMHVNDSLYFDASYKYADLGKLKGSTVSTAAGINITTPENVKGRLKTNMFMVGVGFKL